MTVITRVYSRDNCNNSNTNKEPMSSDAQLAFGVIYSRGGAVIF